MMPVDLRTKNKFCLIQPTSSIAFTYKVMVHMACPYGGRGKQSDTGLFYKHTTNGCIALRCHMHKGSERDSVDAPVFVLFLPCNMKGHISSELACNVDIFELIIYIHIKSSGPFV